MLPPKPISKLHSILALANLLAHNNISQICYCSQISLQNTPFNCSFSDNLTHLGVTFILMAMVHVLCSWVEESYITHILEFLMCEKIEKGTERAVW